MDKFLSLPFSRFKVSAEAFNRAKCLICMSLAKDAMVPPCGHLYCDGCIHQALETKAECPTCRVETSEGELVPSYSHRAEIKGFDVVCNCGTIVTLSRLPEHAASCAQGDTQCRFTDNPTCDQLHATCRCKQDEFIPKNLIDEHNKKCWPEIEKSLAQVCVSVFF